MWWDQFYREWPAQCQRQKDAGPCRVQMLSNSSFCSSALARIIHLGIIWWLLKAVPLFFIPFIYLWHVCMWGSMCMPWYTHGGQRRTCRSYISPFTRDPRDQTQVGQAWWWTLSPTKPSCRPGIIFKYWLWAGSQHSYQLLGHDLAKQPCLVGWPRPDQPLLPRAQGNELFRDICKRAVFFWFTELSFMPMVFWHGDLLCL